MNLSQVRDFAQRYAAAWCSQDPASVAAFFSPQGSLKVNDGAPAVGREAIAEVAHSFMTAFPDMQVVMDNVILEGSGAQFHWTLSGSHTGPGGKGQWVCISGYEEWQMGEDGLIASSLGHFDAAEYQRQLDGERTTEDAQG